MGGNLSITAAWLNERTHVKALISTVVVLLAFAAGVMSGPTIQSSLDGCRTERATDTMNETVCNSHIFYTQR